MPNKVIFSHWYENPFHCHDWSQRNVLQIFNWQLENVSIILMYLVRMCKMQEKSTDLMEKLKESGKILVKIYERLRTEVTQNFEQLCFLNGWSCKKAQVLNICAIEFRKFQAHSESCQLGTIAAQNFLLYHFCLEPFIWK